MHQDERGALVVVHLGEQSMDVPIIGQGYIRTASPFASFALVARGPIVKLGEKAAQKRIGIQISTILLIIREAQ